MREGLTTATDAESRSSGTPVAKKPRRRLLAVVIVAVVVVVLLLTLPLVGTWGLPYHWGCKRGSLVAVGNLWTPVVLVNAPYHATAYAAGVLMSGGEPIGGGGGSIVAANGSSEGLFALGNWWIYSTSTQLQLGPGSSAPCSTSLTPVLAGLEVVLPGAAYVTPIQLAGPGNSTTHGVQTNFTLRGIPSVEWNTNYFSTEQPTANQTACPGGSAWDSPVANRLNVTIPYQNVSLSATLSSEQVFVYDLLPPWNWLIQTSPSGAWAFDYHPADCSS